MSCYNTGRIIKLTREACGISQEELAENICAVQTLSRIENGKTCIKEETYRQFMNKMERFSGRNYAICTGRDLKAMDYCEYIDDAIRMRDYDRAEKYLNRLKKQKISGIVHKQYLMRQNALIRSGLNQISEEEKLNELKLALELTVPNYQKYRNRIYPFTKEEIMILMNMGIIFLKKKQQEKAIEIYDMLIKDLSQNYMSEYDTKEFEIIISFNKMKCLGELKRYKESYDIGKKIFKMSQQYNYPSIMPQILEEMAWDIGMAIKNGELDSSYKQKLYYHLHFGFYLSVANGDEKIKTIFEDMIKNYKNLSGENNSTEGKEEPSDCI